MTVYFFLFYFMYIFTKHQPGSRDIRFVFIMNPLFFLRATNIFFYLPGINQQKVMFMSVHVYTLPIFFQIKLSFRSLRDNELFVRVRRKKKNRGEKNIDRYIRFIYF